MIDRIYIPTYKRHDKQIFYNSLPEQYKKIVIFVIQKQEEHLFTDKNILVVDNNIGIAKTREIIHRTGAKREERYLMVDDDITLMRRNAKYYGRPSNMKTVKRPLTLNDWYDMLDTLDKCHKDNICCGLKLGSILPKFDKPIFYNGGIFCIVSVDGKQLKNVIDELDFNYVVIDEDVNFNLELLTRGYSNAVLDEFCYMQKFNAKGGVNNIRTQKLADDSIKKMNKKFPRYYTILDGTPNGKTIATIKTRVMYSRAYNEHRNS
jgi:hypothetical protein